MTASLTQTPRAPIERTEHPHVVKSAGTLGGEPRVEGGRISVLQIFDTFRAGASAAEIMANLPDLTLAQIHDAVSYGYDHPDEMDFYRNQHRLRTILRVNDMVYVGGRLIPRERLTQDGVPDGVPVYTWETLPPHLDE